MIDQRTAILLPVLIGKKFRISIERRRSFLHSSDCWYRLFFFLLYMPFVYDLNPQSGFSSEIIKRVYASYNEQLVKCCQELCKATFIGVIPFMLFVYVTHELMHKIRLSNKVWHSFILVHPLLNRPPKSCEREKRLKKIVPWFCLRDPRIDAHSQAKR